MLFQGRNLAALAFLILIVCACKQIPSAPVDASAPGTAVPKITATSAAPQLAIGNACGDTAACGPGLSCVEGKCILEVGEVLQKLFTAIDSVCEDSITDCRLLRNELMAFDGEGSASISAVLERYCSEGKGWACYYVCANLLDDEKNSTARPICEKSCTIGFEPGCTCMGNLASDDGDDEAAEKQYRVSCDKGDGTACRNLGLRLSKRKEPAATDYFEKGCKLDEPYACLNLDCDRNGCDRNDEASFIQHSGHACEIALEKSRKLPIPLRNLTAGACGAHAMTLVKQDRTKEARKIAVAGCGMGIEFLCEVQKSLPIEVTAAELDQEYDANELRADDKFKDQPLIITGRVKSVERRAFMDDTTGYQIMLEAGDRWGQVVCDLNPKERDAAVKLNKGDSVKLMCMCKGKVGYVKLEVCLFM
jgi:hypothetical protein